MFSFAPMRRPTDDVIDLPDMDDYKIETLRSAEQAIADAVATILLSTQETPVIVF